jgi:hypothetical protein
MDRHKREMQTRPRSPLSVARIAACSTMLVFAARKSPVVLGDKPYCLPSGTRASGGFGWRRAALARWSVGPPRRYNAPRSFLGQHTGIKRRSNRFKRALGWVCHPNRRLGSTSPWGTTALTAVARAVPALQSEMPQSDLQCKSGHVRRLQPPYETREASTTQSPQQ